MKRILAAGFAAAALLLAPAANASPTEDDYLDKLGQLGFTINSRSAQIDNAYIICERVGNGDSLSNVSHDLDAVTTGINYTQAKAVVALSILYFCPPADV